jgi:SSS family solute:Na+ symporter
MYLVFPVFPAILFGIMSKKVTRTGALVSVIAGIIIATIFVVDQLIGPEKGKDIFPILHKTMTYNYNYRGMWGTIIIALILFAVSAFTQKTDPVRLASTTIDWNRKVERIRSLTDWRLLWLIITALTVMVYLWFR